MWVDADHEDTEKSWPQRGNKTIWQKIGAWSFDRIWKDKSQRACSSLKHTVVPLSSVSESVIAPELKEMTFFCSNRRSAKFCFEFWLLPQGFCTMYYINNHQISFKRASWESDRPILQIPITCQAPKTTKFCKTRPQDPQCSHESWQPRLSRNKLCTWPLEQVGRVSIDQWINRLTDWLNDSRNLTITLRSIQASNPGDSWRYFLEPNPIAFLLCLWPFAWLNRDISHQNSIKFESNLG